MKLFRLAAEGFLLAVVGFVLLWLAMALGVALTAEAGDRERLERHAAQLRATVGAKVHGTLERDSEGIGGTYQRTAFWQLGACDSKRECKARVKELCENAGHVGDPSDIKITHFEDGGKMCSGRCSNGRTFAFQTCDPHENESW
jgi:hypothetical protein